MILKMIQMVLMMFGLVGWMVLAPFVIGMLLIGAVIFAPDMEGY